MREVLDQIVDARAVLFDVDGTLYRQGPVRRTMIARLVRAHVVRPSAGVRVLRVLSAYRRAQEDLRTSGFEGDVAAAQVDRAVIGSGVDADGVRAIVEQWMEVGPLDVVASNPQTGLLDVLDALRRRGVRLGAVSDYPAQRKLEALGIADRFDIVLSAQDVRVHVFKPNPKGLLVALAALGVDPSEAVYVGDRADVDGAAAAAVPMPSVVIRGSHRKRPAGRFRTGSESTAADRMETT